MKEDREETTLNHIQRDERGVKIKQGSGRISVFAPSLLGLRRGRRVRRWARRAASSCVVSGRDGGRLGGGRGRLHPPRVLRQGLLRPGVLLFGHTSVQELHKERSNGSSGKNEDDAGDPSRLAIYESEDLSQVIQNPFTVRRRMTSGIKRAG